MVIIFLTSGIASKGALWPTLENPAKKAIDPFISIEVGKFLNL